MPKKLFLIDGTAIIYRAFFAFIKNPLRNRRGENTSAIYGTINTILRLIDKYNAQYIAISFDRREKTFRHKITETYKANRPPAPEELHAQVEPIKEFFKLINIPEISFAGYEADDILATLTEKFKNDFEVIIVSGDKDFTQLVDEKVMLYDPFKEKVTKEKDVEEKYGLRPEQFIDYLAICGDSADNIPGVRGIGPKGATKLLQEFVTLENIYQNIDKITAKGIKLKLLEYREDAFLSQKLAKIVRDVPIETLQENELSFEKTDLLNSVEMLKHYELFSILKKIVALSPGSVEINIEPEKTEESEIKFEHILVDRKTDFEKMLYELENKTVVAINTETTSTDPISAELVGISLCAENNKAFYISIAHQMADNLDEKFVVNELNKALKDKLLIGHNIKYDYMILQNSGWEIENNVFDTMIADYLLNPTSRHSLYECAKREFDYEMVKISELIGKGKKQITFDLVPTSLACDICIFC